MVVGSVGTLKREEVILFYTFTLTMCTLLCIILLNFVVSQACASYDAVSGFLDEHMVKDRAALCFEADVMRPSFVKTKMKYPKYLIIRKVEQ